MRVLITVTNKSELISVLGLKIDIIDVKNPKEGSLGAPSIAVLRELVEIVRRNMKSEISVPVGDVPNLPGLISLAVFGVCETGVDYLKIGLFGPKNIEDASFLLKEARNAINLSGNNTRLVVVGYADYRRMGCLNPLLIPEIAYKCEADIAMIDTLVKNGEKTTTLMRYQELASFAKMCHDLGLKAAIAGSLDTSDIEIAYSAGFDVIGFRGAVCKKGRTSQLDPEKVVRILNKIKTLK